MNGKAWVSAKQAANTQPEGNVCNSVYGNIVARSGRLSQGGDVVADEGFEVLKVTKRTIRIGFPSLHNIVTFVAPIATFDQIHRKSVSLN